MAAHTSLFIRAATAGVLGALASLPVASSAFAHIDPDPKEAPSGSEQSVGFTVEHGCDGSPTIGVEMRLPSGTSSAVAEPPAGWTGSVAGDIVTFTGGPLPDDVAETFRVRMILPLTPDTMIYFPFVQRCERGEIRWIDIPQNTSGAELVEPAPAMFLTAPVPGTTEPAPAMTAAPVTALAPPTTVGTTSRPTPTTVAATSTTTAPPATTSASPPPAPATVLPATALAVTSLPTSTAPAGDDADDGTPTGLAGALIVGTALAVGMAVWQVRKRR